MPRPRAPRPTKVAPPKTAEEAIPVHLTFGTFDFQEHHRLGQRGGGVRELAALLRAARHQKRYESVQLSSPSGVSTRSNELLEKALQRAQGKKIKDDPTRIAKALAKRRSKKRASAKKWSERIAALQKSVDDVVTEKEGSRYKGKRKDKRSNGKAKTGGMMKGKGGKSSENMKKKNHKDAKKGPSGKGKRTSGKGRRG